MLCTGGRVIPLAHPPPQLQSIYDSDFATVQPFSFSTHFLKSASTFRPSTSIKRRYYVKLIGLQAQIAKYTYLHGIKQQFVGLVKKFQLKSKKYIRAKTNSLNIRMFIYLKTNKYFAITIFMFIVIKGYIHTIS